MGWRSSSANQVEGYYAFGTADSRLGGSYRFSLDQLCHSFGFESLGFLFRSRPLDICFCFSGALDFLFEYNCIDQESGLPRPNEPNNGEHIAFFQSFLSDRTGKPVRSHAANGYLAPVMKRPNLRVITEAIVTRVVLEQDSTRRLYVKGVELLHDKIPHNIFVKKKKLF